MESYQKLIINVQFNFNNNNTNDQKDLILKVHLNAIILN